MSENRNELLMIFTRNPELGKVKTRLAKGIGNHAALEVYKMLLRHTREVTQNIEQQKSVWYSVQIREKDIWEPSIYAKNVQKGKDLGARMQSAFEQSFDSGYQKVIIIGSDLYDLKKEHLQEAFAQLNFNDIVLGPAQDGGYYLLGLKTVIPEIFRNKDWGSDTVLQNTLRDLKNQKVYLLETLNDIDYAEDLEGYKIFKEFLK